MKASSSSEKLEAPDHVTVRENENQPAKDEGEDASTLQEDGTPTESPSPKKQTKGDVVNHHHSSPLAAAGAVLLSEESEKDERTVGAGRASSPPNRHVAHLLLPSASSDTTLTKSSMSTLLTKKDDGETFPSPSKRSSTTSPWWWLSSSPEREQVVGNEEWNPSPAKGWPQRSPVPGEHDSLILNGGSTPLASFDEDHEVVGALAIYGSMIPVSLPHKTAGSPSNMSPLPLLEGGGNDTSPPRPVDVLTQVALVADGSEDTKQQSTNPAIANTKASASSTDPYFVLQSLTKVFETNHFRYVLRSKEQAKNDKVSVNLSALSSVKEFHPKHGHDAPTQDDLAIATRRIQSALCRFGGRAVQVEASSKQSIFRLSKTPEQDYYERTLPYRFAVSESQLLWPVEENPPIFAPSSQQQLQGYSHHAAPGNSSIMHAPTTPGKPSSTSKLTVASQHSQRVGGVKYRCKYCGQPKQNHVCPYQPSLQRSIGVSAYPAINAYTAAEPGYLTQNLEKMNNFVSYDSSSTTVATATRSVNHFPFRHVTPDMKSSRVDTASLSDSPQSSLSTDTTLATSHCYKRFKASHDPIGSNPLFVPSLSLPPEHYRAVSPQVSETIRTTTVDAYQYPAIPVTFRERKVLSDSLFYLAKTRMPDFLESISLFLHQARKCQDWDQCVAELLTQVVVALYCGAYDNRLDGLRGYLLTQGVSC